MARKITEKCTLCGKTYIYTTDDPDWSNMFCSENCYEINNAVKNYRYSKLTEEETKEILESLNTNLSYVNVSIKNVIEKVLKKQITTPDSDITTPSRPESLKYATKTELDALEETVDSLKLGGAELDPSVPNEVKSITATDIKNWNEKLDATALNSYDTSSDVDKKIQDATLNIHSHSNIDVLDKFSENADGDVLYNGAKIQANVTETDPTVPSHVKNITEQNISDWNNKSNFSGDYNDLTNLPSNSSTLDKLSESSDGNLLFNGNEIKGGSTITNYDEDDILSIFNEI